MIYVINVMKGSLGRLDTDWRIIRTLILMTLGVWVWGWGWFIVTTRSCWKHDNEPSSCMQVGEGTFLPDE